MRDKATHHPKAGRETSATAQERNAAATRSEAGTSNSGQHERDAEGTRDAAQEAPCINCCCKNGKQNAKHGQRENQNTQRRELSIGNETNHPQ
jgi:hypothetical protein